MYLTIIDEVLVGPVAVVQVDLDGQVRARVEVTQPRSRGQWQLLGQLDGEVVVGHRQAMQETVAFSMTLYSVSESGLRELTTLAPSVAVRIAGSAVRSAGPLSLG